MTKPPFLASILLFAVLASANAATVNLNQSNGPSESWLTSGHWTPNGAPSEGNDYFVSGGLTVRTPQTAAPSYTFEGDTLTINNARLLFATLGGSNISIDDLTLTNGGMFANGTTATQTLSGGLNISGSAFVRLHTIAADSGRNITIASQITGSGNVGLIQKGTLTLNGTGNTFSGTWTVGGTGVTTPDGTYSNTSTLVSTLMASSEGSLGINSSLVGNAFSILRVAYDLETTGSIALNLNSVTYLDTNWTVGAFSIDGNAFSAGTYSYAFLNTNYDAYFETTGLGGSITVIPEPHTISLLLPLGLGVMLWLRRRRRAVSSTVG